MSQPRTISVVVPTRDRADLLEGVLTALVAQAAAAGGEVVVVDDGSIDRTPELLSSWSADPTLRWVRQPLRGPAAARNTALELVTGEVVLFTGDDMYPGEGLVAGHLARHTGAPVAVVGSVQWDPSIRPSWLMRRLAPEGPLFNFRKLRQATSGLHRFFYTANISVPARVARACPFCEEFPGPAFEDVEWGYRLLKQGVRLEYHEDLVVYHRHPMDGAQLWRRLAQMRTGQRILSKLHPELRPSWAQVAKVWALALAVAAWCLFEKPLGLGPRAPKAWTGRPG